LEGPRIYPVDFNSLPDLIARKASEILSQDERPNTSLHQAATQGKGLFLIPSHPVKKWHNHADLFILGFQS
jgi:hypothetical protein